MSYLITYGRLNGKWNRARRHKRIRNFLLGFLLLIVVGAGFVYPDVVSSVWEIVFPFSQPDVAAALDRFEEHLTCGMDFSDAFVAFGKEILYEANIS